MDVQCSKQLLRIIYLLHVDVTEGSSTLVGLSWNKDKDVLDVIRWVVLHFLLLPFHEAN